MINNEVNIKAWKIFDDNPPSSFWDISTLSPKANKIFKLFYLFYPRHIFLKHQIIYI